MRGRESAGTPRSMIAIVPVVVLVAAMLVYGRGFETGATSQRPGTVQADGSPMALLATPVGSPGATPIASPDMGVLDGAGREAAPGSFEAFGYDDVTARGMFTSVTYRFPLPLATSAPRGGSLDLVYSHSPLLVGDLSTMTVMVNGQSVDSVRLTEETAQSGRLELALPPLEADAGAVQITLAFHLRLTREACEVPNDPALWVTIHKESVLTLPTGAGETEVHLSDAPGLLRRSAEEQELGPAIVLPDRARPEEIDAAGIVSFQIGRWSGQTGAPGLVGPVMHERPEDGQSAVLVGTGDGLDLGDGWGPLAWDGERFTLDGEAIPSGHGVLAIRQQPVPQLLVSGASPAAVLLAANALSRPMDWPTFDAPVVIVSGELPEVNPGRYAWHADGASFAQLGRSRLDVTGPGEHFIDLPFERPADWTLHDGSTLRLDLDISPAVRAETSWVRVTVNGEEIGSQPLRPDDDGVQEYEFALPVERLNTTIDGQPERSLTVQVRIFLDYPHEACESIDPAASWAALLPTSAWVLPHGSYDGLDLGRFPAGLTSADDPVNVSVVLPEYPTQEETQSAMQVLAAVGRWNAWTAPMTPEIRTPRELSVEALQDRSVIVIGGPERNSAAGEFDSAVLSTIQPSAYTVTDEPYGLLALGRSPWSEDATALVVAGSGRDGEGTLLAASALGDQEVIAGMQGTRIAVTGDLGPQTVAGAEPANEAPASLAPHALPDERPLIERLPAWQVVGGIVLVAFLALVIGVVQLRWIRGGRG